MLQFTNARVIDGTGSAPLDRAAIVVEGDRIKEITRAEGTHEGTKVVDLQGMTVLPGLMDCHLHFGGFQVDDPRKVMGPGIVVQLAALFWDQFHQFARRRRLAIEHGVTTLRSAGDAHPHIVALREKLDSGELVGPRIVAPGPIFTSPGGHPASTIYKGIRFLIEYGTRLVSDPEAARVEVQKLAGEGVDCIKTVYSSVNPLDPAADLPRLAFPVLEAIVEEAHSMGLRVMAHTATGKEVDDVVRAGVDSVQHGIMSPDFTGFEDGLVQRMLDQETFYVPTLTAVELLEGMGFGGALRCSQRALKQLSDAGVRIALGTDSGVPGVKLGSAVHRELELMVDSGLSPMQAIVAATGRAAEDLAQPDLGALQAGKRADLIAVTGDPSREIGDIRSIGLVVKDGEILVNQIGP